MSEIKDGSRVRIKPYQVDQDHYGISRSTYTSLAERYYRTGLIARIDNIPLWYKLFDPITGERISCCWHKSMLEPYPEEKKVGRFNSLLAREGKGE